MSILKRRNEASEGAADAASHAEQKTTAQKVFDGTNNVFKKAIGYNDMEANRLGVPYVSSWDWLRDVFHSPGPRAVEYLDSMFPFTKWILSYNTQWLIGDLIAGITVGLVVVPQSLSYAQVATLAPQFGLYSSFVGVLIYVFFATSKDVTIGPVAVMSLQTANVIREVHRTAAGKQFSAEVIASALAFICGVITLGIGLLRIGWIVEFIPTPAVAGFMTGSAFTIAAGQVPKLMGIKGINTNGNPTYKIVIDSLKGLGHTQLDAAFGLGTLVFLYSVRSLCNWIPKKRPRLARVCFFISVFRTAFIIIILTAAVYGWLKHHNPKKYPISLIGNVPSGFRHLGRPNLDPVLFSEMGPQLPVSVIVLLLEHIAISKSFGRLNNYKINPNQELIAIGVTNLVGPAFGAYAATGSFSRSAIKSKSGVRTPFAGWITAIVVIVALYGVAGAFKWIPNAVLSAVIIHAVGDLLAPLSVSYKFWLVSPFEFFIFIAAVVVTVFTSVEYGVYTSVAASAALLLIRIARPRGRWLGRVRITYGNSNRVNPNDVAHRDVFVPLDDRDGLRDPSVRVDPPPPGILIYRFEEAFTYPNASHLADTFLDKVRAETRPGRNATYKTNGDRPWNDPGPVNPKLLTLSRWLSCGLASRAVQAQREGDIAKFSGENDTRPRLRALIFDCSSVSNVDTTSVQCLADVRQAVERYTGEPVEFYFASITSPWIRRALLAAGFGTGHTTSHLSEIAPVVQMHDTRNVLAQRNDEASKDDIETGLNKPAQQRTVKIDDRDVILPAYEGSAAGHGEDSESSYERESASDKAIDELANSGANSTISVPVIWNHDLTPFFHLDISAALAHATGTHDW